MYSHSHRRASKLNAIPSWYGELDAFVMQEAADLAQRRKASTGIDWHVDHMIPLQARKASGLQCGENIQVIPAVLNIAKKAVIAFTATGEWIRGQ